MSGVNIEYKGESIATIPDTGSKTIKTQGKYCEGDILVEYEAPPTPTPTLQSKTVTPTTSQQSVTPDSGYDGLSDVTVNATPLEAKTVTPTSQQQVVTPTAPNIGFSSVTVEGVPKDAFALQLENNLIEYTVTDDVISIRQEGFGYIPSLQKVVFNNSYNITAIQLFHNCKALLTCIFNNPQTLITNDMFWHCDSLQEQICPSSVISIDRYAFEYCGSLTRIVLKAPVVCTLANVNAFLNTPFRNGTGGVAYVPQSLVSEYQNATNWSALESITFLPIEGSPYE